MLTHGTHVKISLGFAFDQECRFNSLINVEFWNEIFQMRDEGGSPDNGVFSHQCISEKAVRTSFE